VTGFPVYTVGYVLDGRGRVLLIRRRRPPFVGLLNGLGGKLEVGEDPLSAWRREVREEAGLEPLGAEVRGVCTWERRTGQGAARDRDPAGLLVVCLCPQALGRAVPGPEGDLEWHAVAEVTRGGADLVPTVPALLRRAASGGPAFSVHVTYLPDGRAVLWPSGSGSAPRWPVAASATAPSDGS
jgi:8-oxo-dGTP diphosphatase